MTQLTQMSRRAVLFHCGQLTAGVSLAAVTARGWAQAAQQKPMPPDKQEQKKEEEVSPVEDLMREHGVLRRIMLIYDHARLRLEVGGEYPVETLRDAAGVIRRFIEEYHEKLEEDHIFPLFEKVSSHADLAATLRRQHEAGRKVTKFILDNAKVEASKDEATRKAVSQHLEMFTRLYRPHAAREDTVLFPAVRQVVTPARYDEMGEIFEDQEHDLFGESGFGGIVEHVAALERQIGIYDLNQFTPHV